MWARFFLSLILVLPIAWVPASSAVGSIPIALPGDPSPHSPEAVSAELKLRPRADFTGLDATVELNIHELELAAGESMPALAIRLLPDKTLFEQLVRARIAEELASAFPDFQVRLVHARFLYGDVMSTSDAFHPAITVDALARIDYSARTLGLKSLGGLPPSVIVAAYFDSGGVVKTDRKITVAPGWNVSVSVEASGDLRVRERDGPLGPRLVMRLDNMANTAAAPMFLRFDLLKDPRTVAPEILRGPLVWVKLDVRDQSTLGERLVPFVPSRAEAHMRVSIEVTSLSIAHFANYELPPKILAPQLSADLLRVAMRSGVVEAQDVHTFFERLVTQSLKEAFGNETEVQVDREEFLKSTGGAIGASSRPLYVNASLTLPLRSGHPLVATSAGRGIGMVMPTEATYPLANDGMWATKYTVTYPPTVRVQASDAEGRVRTTRVDGRDVMEVYLPQGTSASIVASARAAFDPLVFFVQLGELLVIAIGALWLLRRPWLRGWIGVQAARLVHLARRFAPRQPHVTDMSGITDRSVHSYSRIR
jgi:hypothetical protein